MFEHIGDEECFFTYVGKCCPFVSGSLCWLLSCCMAGGLFLWCEWGRVVV